MPDAAIHVWPEEQRDLGGSVEINARLEWPRAGATTIWFRLPSRHLDALTDLADPFVLGCLFPAMRHGHRLHVHGQASLALLRNLEDLQAVWSGWSPGRFRVVEIVADDETDAHAARSDEALLAFSGGLDSCFSAWRHTGGDWERARSNLVAGVMVHGFDIPLDQPQTFAGAAENSRRILDSVGMDLIPVACNLRDLIVQLDVTWRDSHGSLLASCLHLLSGGYATGLIASSHALDALRLPWGSNALTDPMLSSAAFSIVNDGGRYGRREKAKGTAQWDEAMRRLRVCYAGPLKDRNCGRCPRCVFTALCFAVEGVKQPESLPIESLELAVEGLVHEHISPYALGRLDDVLARARAARIGDPWVDALDRVVRSHRRWNGVERVMPWTARPRRWYQLLRAGRLRERFRQRMELSRRGRLMAPAEQGP